MQPRDALPATDMHVNVSSFAAPAPRGPSDAAFAQVDAPEQTNPAPWPSYPKAGGPGWKRRWTTHSYDSQVTEKTTLSLRAARPQAYYACRYPGQPALPQAQPDQPQRGHRGGTAAAGRLPGLRGRRLCTRPAAGPGPEGL